MRTVMMTMMMNVDGDDDEFDDEIFHMMMIFISIHISNIFLLMIRKGD